MKINCEEDESGAAKWWRSVESEHLSKNNEEEKNGPDVIWELKSVFMRIAGSEWSRTYWSLRPNVLLHLAFSSRKSLSNWPEWQQGFMSSWSKSTEVGSSSGGSDALAQRFLKASRFLPSVCSAFFCGSFSFILRLASLLESELFSCFFLKPHCSGKVRGMVWGSSARRSWPLFLKKKILTKSFMTHWPSFNHTSMPKSVPSALAWNASVIQTSHCRNEVALP